MTGRLQNKVIVITGASSGLVSKLQCKLQGKGATPVLMARTEEKLQALVDKIKETYNTPCYYYVLDVSEEMEVQSVFQRYYKKWDVLIY